MKGGKDSGKGRSERSGEGYKKERKVGRTKIEVTKGVYIFRRFFRECPKHPLPVLAVLILKGPLTLRASLVIKIRVSATKCPADKKRDQHLCCIETKKQEGPLLLVCE